MLDDASEGRARAQEHGGLKRSGLAPSRTVPLASRQVTETQTGDVVTQVSADTAVPSVPQSLQDMSTGIPVATVRPDADGEKHLDIPGVMGLIMPDPTRPIYTGLKYNFGFVEPGPRPFKPIEGWTRTVLPILIMTNYTADVFPVIGAPEPDETLDRVCSVSIEDAPVIYEFTFDRPGWHEFVINQTYYQPSTDAQGHCRSPLRFQYTFFSAQLLSVAPLPTYSPAPVATAAQTIWAKVTRETPQNLPIDPLPSTSSKKIIAGMSVFAGIVALALLALILWVVKKRRKEEEERIAFSRLPLEEQQAYLLQNPRLFHNAPETFLSQHQALAQQQALLYQPQMQFYQQAQPLMAQYRPPPYYPSMMSQNAMPPFPAQAGSFGFMGRPRRR